MNNTTDVEMVEINDIELTKGMDLWRYAALNTYNQEIGSHDPDDVLRITAEQLVEKYPEEVGVGEMPDGHDPVEIVHTNLRANPGIYDDTELLRYHAMEVVRVDQSHGETEITIKDWKEVKNYCFTSNPPANRGTYTTFEPLSVLEKHLGVTILPVTEDE